MLSPKVAAELTAVVLDALAFAHGKDVVHRDVKPANVLPTTNWQHLKPGDNVHDSVSNGPGRCYADSALVAKSIVRWLQNSQ